MKIAQGSKLLLAVSIYSILVAIVVLFFYLKILLFSVQDLSYGQIIYYFFIVTVFLFSIYSSCSLIYYRSNILPLLKFNLVFSSLQIFHLLIFGFIFDFFAGIEFMPYIIIDEGFNIGLKFDFWNIVFTFIHRSDASGFVIGISIIPLLTFIINMQIYNSIKLCQARESNNSDLEI